MDKSRSADGVDEETQGDGEAVYNGQQNRMNAQNPHPDRRFGKLIGKDRISEDPVSAVGDLAAQMLCPANDLLPES